MKMSPPHLQQEIRKKWGELIRVHNAPLIVGRVNGESQNAVEHDETIL